MKLVFIRHADPDYEHNTLTAKGFEEIKALGKSYSRDNFTDVYCSPLNRAILTCESIKGMNKNYEIVPWLEEFYHPIVIDGKKKLNWDLPVNFIEKNKKRIFNPAEYLDIPEYKKGNIKKYYKEVVKEFDKVLEMHGYKRVGTYYKVIKPNTDTLLFVCHLGMEMTLLSHLFNCPYMVTTQYFAPAPSSVTTLYSEERVKGKAIFRVTTFGDVNHLYKDNQIPSTAGRDDEMK